MRDRLRIRRGALALTMTLAIALGSSLGQWSDVRADGSGTEVRLEPEATTIRTEDGPLEIAVLVQDVNLHVVDRGTPSEGLGVFQFALHFNPRVVAVSGMEPGSFLANTGRGVSCFSQLRPDDESVFEFACVSSSPPANGPQGSGTLARLTLVPVGGGSSDLVLEGELGGPLGSSEDDIPFKVEDGTVTVIGPPAPTPTPGAMRTPTGSRDDGGSVVGGDDAQGNGVSPTGEGIGQGEGRGADGQTAEEISLAGGGPGPGRAPIGFFAVSATLGVAGAVLVVMSGVLRRRC